MKTNPHPKFQVGEAVTHVKGVKLIITAREYKRSSAIESWVYTCKRVVKVDADRYAPFKLEVVLKLERSLRKNYKPSTKTFSELMELIK